MKFEHIIILINTVSEYIEPKRQNILFNIIFIKY